MAQQLKKNAIGLLFSCYFNSQITFSWWVPWLNVQFQKTKLKSFERLSMMKVARIGQINLVVDHNLCCIFINVMQL
jgi:hypothetical protein